MSMTSYEWAEMAPMPYMTHLLGYIVRVRWDEDWVTYSLYDHLGYEVKQYRGQEEGLNEIRALVMKYMLEGI